MLYTFSLSVLLLFSKQIAAYISEGLLIWFNQMIPALFPTMLWSNLLIQSNQVQSVSRYIYKPLHKLLGVTKNGAYAVTIGFLCGFPLGAKCITDLYRSHKITKEEASFLLSFSNLVGPAFVISYLKRALHYQKTYLLLVLLYGIPFFYGLLQSKFYKRKNITEKSVALILDAPKSIWIELDSSIHNAINSIVILGGYIIAFQIVRIFLLPFPDNTNAFLLPMIEINSGIQALRNIIENSQSTSYRLFIQYLTICYVSFNGLCCCFQTKHCLSGTDLSFKNYLFHKCMITFLTVFFCVFFFYLKITP